MFSTKSVVTLTGDELLDLIGDYQVFEYYLKQDIRKKFFSPFRNEQHPSCAVKRMGDRLIMTDFGTGEHFTAITLVARLHNVSYQKAIQIIASDFHITSVIISKANIQKASKKSKEIERKHTILRTHRIKMTEEAKKYWYQYGITIPTLKRFNVYQIDHYFFGEYNISLKDTLAFEYFFSYKYRKLLMPYHPPEDKWKSNLPSHFIEGLHKLDHLSNVLFLTKAYKDVMVFYEMGYNAIAPAAESNTVNCFTKEIIQNLYEQYDELIVLMDNDPAGEKAAEYLKDTYNLPCFFLSEAKDISDLVKITSFSYAQSIIEESIRKL